MNKGFTLVELIAVIVILALLVIITTPAYDSISNSIRTRNYESKKSTIKSETLKYVEKYLKDKVYDGDTTNSIIKLNINNENKIDESGAERKTNISKALCFTPEYLIRSGIISSDDDKKEVIINDITNTSYSGKEDVDGHDLIYIKVYYNIESLKLDSIIIDEKDSITYKKDSEEEEIDIEFVNVECSQVY